MEKGYLKRYLFMAEGYYCVPVYVIPGDFVDKVVYGDKI